MTIDQGVLDAIVAHIFSSGDFIAECWEQRPAHFPGAARACVGAYDIDRHLADLCAALDPPYLVIRAEQGARVYCEPETPEDLEAEVAKGGVAPLRLSALWHEPDLPASWRWMRALYGAIFRATGMLYMSPERSENVDLFFAGPTSKLGVHYDTSHTFTLQLFGERKWVVEERPDFEARFAAARAPDFNPDVEVALAGPTREVILRPGDMLYVPAYAAHAVTGVRWSISLGLGLRAFNEIDYLAHILERFEAVHYIAYPPLKTFPPSAGARHDDAKAELLRRTRALLKQLELTAIGALMAPSRLPDTLGPLEAQGDDSLHPA
jgi:ribosomal protein L16 Arg81 hydroxylase